MELDWKQATVLTINVGLDMVGVVFFVALILATVKHKKLHGTCHMLIGIYALCSLLSKLIIVLPYFSIMLSFTTPLLVCAIVQLLPLYGQINVFPLMLAIGVDRVLGVFFPVWYKNRNGKYYLPIVYALSSLYPLLLTSLILINAANTPLNQVSCGTALYAGLNMAFLTTVPLCFNACTICCYLLIVVKLFYGRWTGQTVLAQSQKSLFKSLGLIMAIQIGGWTIAYVGFSATDQLNQSAKEWWIFTYLLQCLSSLSSTVEVPALYFTSTEHRLALRKEFAWFFRLFSKASIVNSSNVVVVSKVILVPGGVEGNNNTNSHDIRYPIS